jgi:LPPG:FO 2-phospho-L-lactate transferase
MSGTSRKKTPPPRVAALAGGVGASKLLLGLYHELNPETLDIIVNTGDDIVLHALQISPDLDIVSYTLAGIVDTKKGWGLRRDTFHALARLREFGRQAWFNLGDSDLATHLHRTALLASGKSLADAAEDICRALGVRSRILPMSNQSVPTIIHTSEGPLHFQEYLVKRRAQPIVRSIHFENVAYASPAPGVLTAIREARRIFICPSNPLISIGPILAIPGIRVALCERKADIIAVCPIVGGKSLKGPSDRMLAQLGHEVSARGVARLYADFTGTFVVDPADRGQVASIRSLGMNIAVIPTVMCTLAQKRKLARALLAL